MNAAADLWITPSLYEGFCVAAVEAMAVGVPVLVSDIDVLREVVGNNGLFAKQGDSQSFSEQIIKALQNPEEIAQRGQLLKKRVDERYTIERAARQHVELYRNVISKWTV